jgi:putative phage-type endonuclease
LTPIPEQLLSKADVLLNVDEATREDWLTMRGCGLGGSDALAASGLSQYKSPYALWLEKTGMVEFPDEDNEFMAWGRRLEPVIADAFADETGLTIQRLPYLFRSKEHPFMLADIDRLIYDKETKEYGVLEIKNTSSWNARDWVDEAPLYATVQNLHYQICLGLKWGYVAGLIGGNHLEIHKVVLDDDVESDILALEDKFWRQVQNNEPPALDGSNSTLDALRLRYNEPEAERVDLPHEALDLIGELEQVKSRMKSAKDREQTIKVMMMSWLGNNTEGVIGDSLVTWKPNKKGTRTMRFTKLKEE